LRLIILFWLASKKLWPVDLRYFGQIRRRKESPS